MSFPKITHLFVECFQYPLVFYQRPLEDAKVKKLEEAFEFLNAFFSTNKTDYVCGEDLTIADYSIVAGVSTIEVRF